MSLAPYDVVVEDPVVGGVLDEQIVERAVSKCDAVVHAAAAFAVDPRRADEMRRTNARAAELGLHSAVADGWTGRAHLQHGRAHPVGGSGPGLPLGDEASAPARRCAVARSTGPGAGRSPVQVHAVGGVACQLGARDPPVEPGVLGLRQHGVPELHGAPVVASEMRLLAPRNSRVQDSDEVVDKARDRVPGSSPYSLTARVRPPEATRRSSTRSVCSPGPWVSGM